MFKILEKIIFLLLEMLLLGGQKGSKISCVGNYLWNTFQSIDWKNMLDKIFWLMEYIKFYS